MSETILFDRDEIEHLESIHDRPRRLSGERLLWVGVDRNSAEEAKRVAEALGLDSSTQQEARGPREAIVGSFDVLIARGGQPHERDHEGADADLGDPAPGR